MGKKTKGGCEASAIARKIMLKKLAKMAIGISYEINEALDNDADDDKMNALYDREEAIYQQIPKECQDEFDKIYDEELNKL